MPLVFVTGVPFCGKSFNLARELSDNLRFPNPMVQTGSDRELSQQLSSGAIYWPKSSFEGTHFKSVRIMSVNRAIVRATAPAIIEGTSCLTCPKALLASGHIMVVQVPMSWIEYEQRFMRLTQLLENSSRPTTFEEDYLKTSFNKILYDYFAPEIEEVVKLKHPRVITYHHCERATQHVMKLAELLKQPSV